MASRFWTQGASDSEEEEEEVEEESEEEEEEDASDDNEKKRTGASTGATKASIYLRSGDSDSDDSDDGRGRVVRPARERRFDEMVATVEQIRNQMKINDWVALQESFEKLNKQLEKVMRLTESSEPPRPYLRGMMLLEDHLNTALANKEAKKKMSSSNAKALNYMKQKLKKNNKQYEAALDRFRANPESEDEDEEEEEDEDEDDEDEDEDEDEEEEAGSAEDEEDGEGWQKQRDKRERSALEKQFQRDPSEIKWEDVNSKLREIVAARGRKGTDRAEQVEQLTYLAKVAKTPAQLLEVLVHVVSAQFDVSQNLHAYLPVPVWRKCVENLLVLLDVLAAHPNLRLEELTDAAAADEDAETSKGDDFAGIIRVSGSLVAFVERVDDELFKSFQAIDPYTRDYVDRLRDEPLFLALAQNAQDYTTRVGDMRGAARLALRRCEHIYYKPESVFSALRHMSEQQAADSSATAKSKAEQEGEDDAEEEAAAAAAVFATGEAESTVARDARRRAAVSVLSFGPPGFVKTPAMVPRQPSLPGSSREFMDALAAVIYQHGDERIKARAMLCDIYHRALLDQFHSARDLMLISHLQDSAQHMDILTQILFNRAMAQLGMAAFRASLVPEAHACLAELYAAGRVKELLAQGVSQSRFHDKTPEQERLERRRQMPYHMHINLELLEAVHLLSAMLLEVPLLAASQYAAGDARRRVVSKNFRRLLESYERQTFTGPPENVRDHVMSSAHSLLVGDWRRAVSLASGLEVWRLLGEEQRANVQAMLSTRIQQEALRTFLFKAAATYHSLSLDQLVEMFSLSEQCVVNTVSRMIVSEDLSAAWDQPSRTVIIMAANPSRLQHLAMQFADKLTILADSNERAFSDRTGGLAIDTGLGGGTGERGGERERERGGRRGKEGGEYGGWRRDEYRGGGGGWGEYERQGGGRHRGPGVSAMRSGAPFGAGRKAGGDKVGQSVTWRGSERKDGSSRFVSLGKSAGAQ